MAYEVMVVLGHPEVYPRFGFRKASDFGIRCQYDIPDEVFMALELGWGALEGISGTMVYQLDFKEV
ncbi:hypothetical protein ACFLXC_05700 [Chloroflexota bacterium]